MHVDLVVPWPGVLDLPGLLWAALPDVAPDHLDWHGDFEAYLAAEAPVSVGQTDQDWAVVPRVDTTIEALLARAPGALPRMEPS